MSIQFSQLFLKFSTVVLLVGSFLCVCRAQQTYVWQGTTSSSVTTNTNWIPTGVPGVSDSVVIPATLGLPNAPVVPVDLSVAWQSLTFDGGGSSLGIVGNLNISLAITVRLASTTVMGGPGLLRLGVVNSQGATSQFGIALGSSPSSGSISLVMSANTIVQFGTAVTVSNPYVTSAGIALIARTLSVPFGSSFSAATASFACSNLDGTVLVGGTFGIGGNVDMSGCTLGAMPNEPAPQGTLQFLGPFTSVPPPSLASFWNLIVSASARTLFSTGVSVASLNVQGTVVLGSQAFGPASSLAISSTLTSFSTSSKVEVCNNCNSICALSPTTYISYSGSISNLTFVGSLSRPTVLLRGLYSGKMKIGSAGGVVLVYPLGSVVAMASPGCPPGTFVGVGCSGFGSLQCVACPNGTYSNTYNAASCTVCPTNTGAYPPGQTFCSACPCGTTFVSSTTPCAPSSSPCFNTTFPLPSNNGTIVSNPPAAHPGSEPPFHKDIPGYAVLGGTLGVVIITSAVLGACLCCTGCGAISGAFANAAQAWDTMGARNETAESPGPVVEIPSAIGGVMTILALLLFIGLSVFLVLDWFTTTTSTASLLPFGHVMSANDANLTGQFVFSATFFGFTGASCSGCSSIVTGLATTQNATCVQLDATTCQVSLNTGPNVLLSSTASVQMYIPGSTASAITWSLSTSPFYDDGSVQNVSQSLIVPIGGAVDVDVAVTYVVRTDETYLQRNSQGWLCNWKQTQVAPTDLSYSNTSCNIQFRVDRGINYLSIDVQLTESIAVLLSTIFSFGVGVFILANALTGLIRSLQRRKTGTPEELKAWHDLYKRVSNPSSVPMNHHGNVGEQFHASQTHL